ncbi:46037_t:CDS:1 [Gigaspora margarita]|uniref:46037_t:CDS:1 n=1 Tax=Gigaspora margarita TaxID=4874 RepID=A0ABN7V8D4_GIGMA|nr:46037_t:CDS:1 [Gigaspora margarita]
MRFIFFIIFLLSPLVFGRDSRKCLEVSHSRDGLKLAAQWVVDSNKSITYTNETLRWSGINNYNCPKVNVPSYADCSSFVTWLYWSVLGFYPDYLNDQNWASGYTGTMADHGEKVSLSNAQPGDIVLYGAKYPYNHTAIYVGNNQVVNFGATGPAKLLNIDLNNYFGNDYHIRTYQDFFAVGTSCNDLQGTCIDTDVTKCAKPLITGKCKGPSFVKCCPK